MYYTHKLNEWKQKFSKNSKMSLSIISVLEWNVYEMSQHIVEKYRVITNNMDNE